MRPVFFRSTAAFRRWLQKHHDTASELLVAFYKTQSGKGGITYPEALDEALCFGWIDGVRRRLDDDSYTIRFSPRKPRSIWSAVNIRRAKELVARKRMQPAGLRAFDRRDPERSSQYSYERQHAELPEPYLRQFRSNEAAWTFFEAQPPSYRRLVAWYVMSAKKDETRQRRLADSIRQSAERRRITETLPARARRGGSQRAASGRS